MTLAQVVTYTLSSLTVLAEAMSLVLLVTMFFTKGDNAVIRFFKKYGMEISFIVVFTATAGSLTFSNVLGYTPCELCWFQRILMYPLVIILGVGFWHKVSFKTSTLYALILSLIGVPLAFYHYLIQLGLFPAPCTTAGITVSCAKHYTLTFGYITIPIMALSAFLLVALIMLVLRSDKNAHIVDLQS